MTNHETCTYPGDREGAIIDFLYGEGDAASRAVFERHIVGCAECRAEVEAYRGVRRALADWAPPEPARAPELSPMLNGPRLAVAREASTPSSLDPAGTAPPSRPSLWTLPTWARVAAAVLCVGIGAGAANLRVTYSSEGLTVRTGWRGDTGAEPWRAEVAALTEQIRALQSPNPGQAVAASVPRNAGTPQAAGATGAGEHQGAGAPGVGGQGVGAPGVVDDALMKQVRTLIARSEQRQQRELALRLGDALNDVQVQRRADLARIDRTIGVMQNSTGMDLLRQREAINTLAVRVSSQR